MVYTVYRMWLVEPRLQYNHKFITMAYYKNQPMAVGHPHHTKAEILNIAEDEWKETEEYPFHPK